MKKFLLRKEMEEPEKSKYSNGTDSEMEVKNTNNHIFFYSVVNNKSAQELNIKLKEIEQKLLLKQRNHEEHKEYIYLHINSYGGSIFSAFSIMDTIKNIKVPVISIIEGTAASAGTLISIVCDYRIIYKTSYMLIHQLSSCSWGKMSEIEEEFINLQEIMNKIKQIYTTYTTISIEEIAELLTHDLWWNADICLEKGLVDEIKITSRAYDFDKKYLKIS